MHAPSPTTDNALSPEAILEMASAFQRSRVLLTACELDLFTVLGEARRSSAEVARALGTDERATDRLMNALCAIGLLQKSEGRFSNTPPAARFLVRGGPDFLANLGHIAHLWDTWSTLTQAVREGRSVQARPVKAHGAEWFRAFIAAMHWRATRHAPQVVASLDLGGVSRVLDVGGGSGAYAMAFARARGDIHAVVFDLPAVVPLAEEYIRHGGLADRVKTVAGDFEADPLGGAFDLAFLSAILHGNSAAQNRALLRKAAEALNPRGQLVVQDFIMAEDRTTPAFGALFALNMLVGTEAGDTYTESLVRGWMEEAGLGHVVRQDTAFGASLMIGRKAGC
jgi:ubiquinone/menaquinone biosynthesis C-methylase UbiE